MFEAPVYLVTALRMLAVMANNIRPDLGNIAEDGKGEFYSETFGFAAWHQDDETTNTPQFCHPAMDIEVRWHRTVGRATYVNREVTLEETIALFNDVMGEMEPSDWVTYVKW